MQQHSLLNHPSKLPAQCSLAKTNAACSVSNPDDQHLPSSFCLPSTLYFLTYCVVVAYLSGSSGVWLMRGAPKCSSGVVRGGPKLVMGFQLVLLSCVILGLLFLGAIKGIFVGNVSIVLGTYIPGPIYRLSNLTHTHIYSLTALPYMHTHTHTCSSPIHAHTYSHLQLSHTCTHILTLAALPYIQKHTLTYTHTYTHTPSLYT